MRILTIGFDGLDYRLFRQYNKHIANLLPLLSPVPLTGPAWTSIYTGESVLHHGIRDGWGREIAPGKYPIKVSESYATTKAFYLWDILSKYRHTVKLVNIPVTFPPRKVKGVHVAGFPISRKQPFSYPKSLRVPKPYYRASDLIQSSGHDAIVQPIHEVWKWKEPIKKMGVKNAIKKLHIDCSKILNFFKSLKPAEFQMVQFSFPDRLGHLFGYNKQLTELIYGLVNLLILQLKRYIPHDYLFIVSDHGFVRREHTKTGVFGYEGKNTITPKAAKPVTVKDFAPTVLRLFGIKYNCDGRAVTEIFKALPGIKSTIGRKKGDVSKAKERKAAKILKERMKKLGYFD